jgi:hypothetical protein
MLLRELSGEVRRVTAPSVRGEQVGAGGRGGSKAVVAEPTSLAARRDAVPVDARNSRVIP